MPNSVPEHRPLPALKRPLTTHEVADLCHVTTRTIAAWRASGKIPYLRWTSRVFRYDAEQVLRTLARKEVR